MTVTDTVKKVITDQTYATVGVTDLVVESLRDYAAQIASMREELEPKKVQARIKAAPAEAQTYYNDLTKRGEDLVARIRNQKATQDLVDQAEATVSLGKGAVTSVRKAAADVERSAKSTLTIGRKEAAKAADAVADSVTVDVDAEKAKEAVEGSAKRTTSAAKGTSTTTKKGAARTRTAAKATATSAKKTAEKTTKAAEKAAEKVGD